MKAKRSSPRWLVGSFHRRRGQSRWPRRVAADKGYSYPRIRQWCRQRRIQSRHSHASQPATGRSTSTRPPIGSDTSSSRSWAGTRSIVPWAPVTRNLQSTMLLYGWWPLWTRPSIGYSQTERSRHTHTPCGIHLTNEKQEPSTLSLLEVRDRTRVTLSDCQVSHGILAEGNSSVEAINCRIDGGVRQRENGSIRLVTNSF